jgi:membrane protein
VVARHVKAVERANGLRFTRWAAAMALFAYLALFPLLVLAFIAFGALLGNFPELRADVEAFLRESIPVLFEPQGERPPVDIEQVARATISAGVVSVVALLVAGLGWVDATLEGVRRMQGAMRRPRNWFLLRLQDSLSLLAMGSVLLIALVGAVTLEAAGSAALDWVGIDESARAIVQLTAVVVLGLLVWLVVTSLYGLAWLRRPARRWRTVSLGALYATAVMVGLSQLSFVIVGRTLSNPVYGTLAVAAALLIFLYVTSMVLLYFACWVAVVDGAPPTAEEVAYRDRLGGGAITLPTVDAGGTTSRPRAADLPAHPPAASATSFPSGRRGRRRRPGSVGR